VGGQPMPDLIIDINGDEYPPDGVLGSFHATSLARSGD
jgi:hypothetical protein